MHNKQLCKDQKHLKIMMGPNLPRPNFPGAPFVGAQFAAKGPNLPGPDLPKNGKLGPKKCGAQFAAKSARGPICRGPICRGPICLEPFCKQGWFRKPDIQCSFSSLCVPFTIHFLQLGELILLAGFPFLTDLSRLCSTRYSKTSLLAGQICKCIEM